MSFQSKADHPRMCIWLRSYDLELGSWHWYQLDLDPDVRKYACV